MAMCYLCDLCANKEADIGERDCGVTVFCKCHIGGTKKLAIDYGRDDPKETCEHFERKVDA